MHSGNRWDSGSFEVVGGGKGDHHRNHYHYPDHVDDEAVGNERNCSRDSEWDKSAVYHENQQQHEQLTETQKSWLLEPNNFKKKNKKKYVDLGCIVCSRMSLKWTLWSVVLGFCVIGLPIIIVKTLPNPKPHTIPPDSYSLALQKALLFFNAQKSGRLPKSNGIPWRGDSGLNDGKDNAQLKETGLVGGYYDAGDNVKFHFPMAYTLTMLSWSVIEYGHKYENIGEYNHVRELIKWGTDYLLLTFNSSATKIDKIYCQVGGAPNGSKTPNDEYCWQKPESMDYPRYTQICDQGPDLAGEMAAALAAASIVFQDNNAYSQKLVSGAETVYAFARDKSKRRSYSRDNPFISPYYKSTGYFDEYIWGATWLYYATGNTSYISLATTASFSRQSKAFLRIPQLSVPSWNNKLPAAMLLLTRFRMFLSPGYPYEDMLQMYHNTISLTMCSYFQQFNVFNFTRGGLIMLNQGGPQPLQFAANAAFLASLYADYMGAIGVPGFYCSTNYFSQDDLRDFAISQVDYILGKNPMKISYIVGYGKNFPRHVHHRGASIPNDNKHYSCTGGYKWRDTANSNPHNITGAMVGGPDQFDRFKDVRTHYDNTKPTLAGNAGLVAALVSLTNTAGSSGIDKNTMFSAIPPLTPQSPPPPPPWKP